jgi:hypothetical protein
MSDRYTRRDAEMAFEHLAETARVTIADPAWKITDRRRLGAWSLDYNGVYGGFTIQAFVADSPPRDDRPQAYTAITHPLNDRRLPAREFAQACHFAARAIAAARGGHGSTRAIRKAYAPRKTTA